METESTSRGVKFLELCKDHQWEKVKKILTEQPNLINCESWSHVYIGITTFFIFRDDEIFRASKLGCSWLLGQMHLFSMENMKKTSFQQDGQVLYQNIYSENMAL